MRTHCTRTALAPLPTHWPVRGVHYGERISLLPRHYKLWAQANLPLGPALRAAFHADQGFTVLANDQREGC